MSAIKCVGILTSGGDAPGMNAAIRAVTRSAIFSGLKVKGIYRGYKGLIADEIVDFRTQNVSNIIQQGGTILKTARCMVTALLKNAINFFLLDLKKILLCLFHRRVLELPQSFSAS